MHFRPPTRYNHSGFIYWIQHFLNVRTVYSHPKTHMGPRECRQTARHKWNTATALDQIKHNIRTHRCQTLGSEITDLLYWSAAVTRARLWNPFFYLMNTLLLWLHKLDFTSSQRCYLTSSGVRRKSQKEMTEDRKTTAGHNMMLGRVKGQAPEPTHRGQASVKTACSGGNYSVQTCVACTHTHTDGLCLTHSHLAVCWECPFQ